MVEPYEGARDVVRQLEADGAKLALVTSKMRRGTALGLRRADLEDAFDTWVCADDVVRGKPDPEPVLRALEALGTTPSAAVFVGDSPHDLAAAKGAGTYSAAATWGPFAHEDLAKHAPDFWLKHPRDILTIRPG
jgi:pyrophosphatase PpaX